MRLLPYLALLELVGTGRVSGRDDGNSYANEAFHGKGVDGADDARMKAGKAAVHPDRTSGDRLWQSIKLRSLRPFAM